MHARPSHIRLSHRNDEQSIIRYVLIIWHIYARAWNFSAEICVDIGDRTMCVCRCDSVVDRVHITQISTMAMIK